MATWIPGQSGNPKRRARPMRVAEAHAVRKIGQAIGRERLEFPGEDLPLLQSEADRATYSRLERLLRVLWTMALGGNLAAARLLFEYIEGKPGQQEDGADGADPRPLTQKQVAELIGASVAKVEEWRAEGRGAKRGDETFGVFETQKV